MKDHEQTLMSHLCCAASDYKLGLQCKEFAEQYNGIECLHQALIEAVELWEEYNVQNAN